jgi:hypothetical protein
MMIMEKQCNKTFFLTFVDKKNQEYYINFHVIQEDKWGINDRVWSI